MRDEKRREESLLSEITVSCKLSKPYEIVSESTDAMSDFCDFNSPE